MHHSYCKVKIGLSALIRISFYIFDFLNNSILNVILFFFEDGLTL